MLLFSTAIAAVVFEAREIRAKLDVGDRTRTVFDARNSCQLQLLPSYSILRKPGSKQLLEM